MRPIDDILCTVDEIEFLPDRKNPGDAGADLKARCMAMIGPGETVNVPTGVKMAIPYGCVGLVFPRSGLATKQGLRLANCVGVIDSGYRGEIGVPLHNDSNETRCVEKYHRIAQLVILDVNLPEFMVVEALPGSVRGEGGFGSTGK